MKKVFALVAVVVAILVVGTACGVAQEDYKAVVAERDSTQAELQSVKSELAAVKSLTLPEGYIKASDVIPAMGEHWLNPASPADPIYLVYKGNVIGIEPLWTEDMMEDIPGPPGETIKGLPSIPLGAIVDHIDVGWMTPGVHEGPPVDHWEMHIYFITQAEKAAITP